MSLKGTGSATNLLRGSINSLKTLTLSAYAIAVQNGFEGTEEEWLASLKGEKGEPGNVFDELTEDQKESIKGENGHSIFYCAAGSTTNALTVNLSYIQNGDREVQVGDMLITSDGGLYKINKIDSSTFTATLLSIIAGANGENATDEQVAAAVEAYMAKNPVLSVPTVRVAEVALLATKWVGDASPYSQVVTIPDITIYSQVDLTPSVEQLAIFHDKDLAFVTENEDGVVTVYAIGDKPLNDYTMQVTIKEVSV